MYIDISEFISDASELTLGRSGTVEIEDYSNDFELLEDPRYDLILTKVDKDIYLSLKLSYKYKADCDRCLATVEGSQDTEYQAKLVQEYPEEDDNKEYEEYVLYENGKFNLSELIRQLVILSVPTKILCDENCKGICPQCGTDLNSGECQCEAPSGDIRFAILEDLVLDDEEE